MKDKNFPTNPFTLFTQWFEEAKASNIDPTIMTLATATLDGKPSLRVVLLKAFDEKGLVFYTNFLSRKAQELKQNPQAAVCFYWQAIEKQVRVEGKVEVVSDAEADAYFATRLRGSQIGAWASKQSQPMSNREEFHQHLDKLEDQFKNKNVPRPEFWSGFRLLPETFEFWQQGIHRLHERIRYHKSSANIWTIEYLYP